MGYSFLSKHRLDNTLVMLLDTEGVAWHIHRAQPIDYKMTLQHHSRHNVTNVFWGRKMICTEYADR